LEDSLPSPPSVATPLSAPNWLVAIREARLVLKVAGLVGTYVSAVVTFEDVISDRMVSEDLFSTLLSARFVFAVATL
jgi:hypothetical protein